jgi:hypothetical protein
MKRIERLTESDLKRLVKRIVVEQEETIQVNQMAKKRFDELYNKVSKGFCVPAFDQGSLMTIKCKDGHYWQMKEFRKFGKE